MGETEDDWKRWFNMLGKLNRSAGFVLFVLTVLASFSAQAAVPTALSYQGFLTDSVGNPVTGTWTVTFGLFADPNGGAPLFEESLDVTTDKGLFSVYLGTPDNPLPLASFESGTLFLELTVETDDGPVSLTPRQQVVSDPFALYAQDAAQLGGEDASAFVLLQQLPDLCVTPEALPDVLTELGITGGGLDEEALAAWLLANSFVDEVSLAAWLLANGYDPCACYGDEGVAAYLAAEGFMAGPHFSGLYGDLVDSPDLSSYVTAEDVEQALSDLGAVLLADGSVALEGNLDFAGYQALNLAVHNSEEAPEEPVVGQLWWDLTEGLLKVHTGDGWSGIGTGVAADIACPECVDADDVAFTFAAADQKGGAALNVNCFQCINADEVSFAWAKGVLPGGDAEHALTADTAVNALTAETAGDVECPGCVDAGDLAVGAMHSDKVVFDDTKTQIGAGSVQAALEHALSAGASGAVEGNGTIVPFVEQWGLPAYGEATTYVHLMNPSQPKVLAHLYAGESSSFSTSNNLVVAYSFAPNQYSGGVNGTAGEQALQVTNPSSFSVGAHILIHQTVGTGGNGTNAGQWELSQVLGIEGSTLLLAKELQHTFTSCGNDCGYAQAVVAASYNQLEVVNGGTISPSMNAHDQGDKKGSIIFIRARKIVLKTGGKIQANGYGPYNRGDTWGGDYRGETASSQCKIDNGSWGPANNCSGGGGGGKHIIEWSNTCGGGGGGNKTAGQKGKGNSNNGGHGGSAWGDANADILTFGGSGGSSYYGRAGWGGGLIVLGAETIIVENGASITANGNTGDCPWGNHGSHGGGGGGAGGSIVLFAKELLNSGTVTADGGAGKHCGDAVNIGGNGGDGWVIHKDPVDGTVNESFAKGVELWLDGENVTAQIGDPNAKGAPAWNADDQNWGADGLAGWSTGPLDLTAAANWTLGEHKIQLKETGGAGGDVKLFTYIIYPFTKSTPPVNDTCDQPVLLDVSGPTTVTGTTEDIMGKLKATDAHSGPFCGGAGGPEVVYAFTLEEWRQLTLSVTSAFTPRVYIKKGSCTDGEVVACGTDQVTTGVFEPGTYYLFLDSDGNLQKGDFSLTVTPTPPDSPANDSCAGPEQLLFQNNVAQISGMTLFSNDLYSAACGGAGAPENVFTFTVPAGLSSLDIAVDADYDPAIYVVKDSCDGNPVACIPANSYQMGWPGSGVYYLFLDGKTANDEGLYTLTITLNQ